MIPKALTGNLYISLRVCDKAAELEWPQCTQRLLGQHYLLFVVSQRPWAGNKSAVNQKCVSAWVWGNSHIHKQNKYAGGITKTGMRSILHENLKEKKKAGAKMPDVFINCAEHENKFTVWICILDNHPQQYPLLNTFEYANASQHKKPWQAVITWFQWLQL